MREPRSPPRPRRFFACLADYNAPRCSSTVSSAHPARATDQGEGAQFEAVLKVGPRTLRTTIVIASLVPRRSITWSSAGDNGQSLSFELDPDQDETTVSLDDQLRRTWRNRGRPHRTLRRADRRAPGGHRARAPQRARVRLPSDDPATRHARSHFSAPLGVPIQTLEAKVQPMEYAVRCVVGIELKARGLPKVAMPARDLERHVHDPWESSSTAGSPGPRSKWTSRSCEATFSSSSRPATSQRAMSKAWGVLSMAVHAAGGATSHRPFPLDAEWSVRLLKAEALPRLKTGQNGCCTRLGETARTRFTFKVGGRVPKDGARPPLPCEGSMGPCTAMSISRIVALCAVYFLAPERRQLRPRAERELRPSKIAFQAATRSRPAAPWCLDGAGSPR